MPGSSPTRMRSTIGLAKKLWRMAEFISRLLYFISSKPWAVLFLSVFIFGLGVTLIIAYPAEGKPRPAVPT